MSDIGGLSAAEMNARYRARMDRAKLTVKCALCRFKRTGPAGLVLAEQRDHRLLEHGLKPSRRSSRHLSSFRAPTLTDEDRNAIESDIAKRKRLHGIEVA